MLPSDVTKPAHFKSALYDFVFIFVFETLSSAIVQYMYDIVSSWLQSLLEFE